jgi:hypothetical protein
MLNLSNVSDRFIASVSIVSEALIFSIKAFTVPLLFHSTTFDPGINFIPILTSAASASTE